MALRAQVFNVGTASNKIEAKEVTPPGGGELTRVALPWLDWQLKGKPDASKTFLSEDSELRRDPKWTVELKKFPAPK